MSHRGFPAVRPSVSNAFLQHCASDFDLLRPTFEMVALNQEAVLSRAGDQIEYVFFPHSGAISLMVDMADAQTVATAAVGREGAVAYVVVDAVIDLEWTRKRWPERPDDFFVEPRAIADEIWHVVHQDRSAWSFNVELRPFGENW
jgi:hypothetical protein